MEFQKINSELENLQSLLVAYDYVNYEKEIVSTQEKSVFLKNRIDHLKKKSQLLEEQINEFQTRIKEVLEDRSQFGGAFFEYEEQIKEIGKEIAKIKTQLSNKLNSRKEEKEGQDGLLKNLEESKLILNQCAETASKLDKECSATINEHAEISRFVNDTENLVQTLTTGLAASEGQENGYIDKLNSNCFL